MQNSISRPSVKRVAVVNRGEAALRFLRTSAVMTPRVEAVLLYTDVETHSSALWAFDQRQLLEGGANAYQDAESVLKAAQSAGCDSAWLGWGFSSERADFIRTLEEGGLVVLGPTPKTLEQLGDKANASQYAAQAGFTLVPSFTIDLPSDVRLWKDFLIELLEGAPLPPSPWLLKATEGGGGRGIFEWREREDEASPQRLQRLGDWVYDSALVTVRLGMKPRFILESRLTQPRHIELQLIGDGQGNAWVVGARECSVQRRHQKLIEECPPANIDPTVIEEASRYAVELGRNLHYRGVGTVELLYSTGNSQLYFLEVNPRLQVEHPITELVYGIDLVELQIRIARGEAIDSRSLEHIEARGVAVEGRLYAEDPNLDFSPTSGELVKFRIPLGPGIRVDSGYQEGDHVIGDFDPMLAKVIAHAGHREAAIKRLSRALSTGQILIRGGATNQVYLKQVLQEKDFLDAKWHTQKTLTTQENTQAVRRDQRSIALLARAIDLFLRSAEVSQVASPQFNLISGEIPLRIYRLQPHLFLCVHEELSLASQAAQSIEWILIEYRAVNDHAATLSLYEGYERPKRSYHIERIYGDTRYWVDGESHELRHEQRDHIIAPSLGVVLSIQVQTGDRVKQGQTLLKLESMKVEIAISAPRDGVVSVVYGEHDQIVQSGEHLISLEPECEAGLPMSLTIPWSSGQWPMFPVIREAALGWDLPPPSLLETSMDVELTMVQQDELFRLTDDFLDRAQIFDRRAKQTELTSVENHALNAQPRRMIETYLRGDTESLPADWLTRFESCLLKLKPSDHFTQIEESVLLFWRCARLMRSREELERLSRLLAYCLDQCHSIPQRLVDRLASSDPERYSELVELASDRSLRLSAELSRKRGFESEFEDWLSSADEIGLRSAKGLSQARLSFHPESTLSLLMSRASEGDSRSLLRLAETLSLRAMSESGDPHHAMFCGENGSSDHVAEGLNDDELWVIVEPKQHKWSEPSVLKQTHFVPFEQLDQTMIGQHRYKQVFIIDLYGMKSLISLQSREAVLRSTMIEILESIPLEDMNGSQLKKSFERYVGGLSIFGLKSTSLGTAQVEVRHYDVDEEKNSRDETLIEQQAWRDLTPRQLERLAPQRWIKFNVTRLLELEQKLTDPISHELGASVFAYQLRGCENPDDVRIFTYAEICHLNRRRGRPLVLPEIDQAFYRSIKLLFRSQALVRSRSVSNKSRRELYWNRIILRILPPIPLGLGVIKRYMNRLLSAARWVGLEKLVIRARFLDRSAPTGLTPLMDVSIYHVAGQEASMVSRLSSQKPLLPRTRYESQVVSARKRGLTHPAEVIHLLEGGGSGIPRGRFTLLEFNDLTHELCPSRVEKIFDGDVVRDSTDTRKRSGVIVGEISTQISRPQMLLRRVVILSDPTLKMAALGQDECDRIMAALRFAEAASLPIDWLTVSSGAKIDWDTGTENLDACAEVLKGIISFTQRGGMINLLVTGPAVGAQSYWNAEATMMSHCRGALIMTDRGAMVLTGKRALDISGCVSASDDVELGGYTSVMGPNGQAQFHALDVLEALQTLYSFYRCCYLPPNARRVPRRESKDPSSRDIGQSVYPESLEHGFTLIREIFSDQNRERKRPFAIKPVMSSLRDQDDVYLDRWSAWEGAETVVVWQCRVSGYAVTMIGIENQAIQRLSPTQDGPQQWRGGTLYPQSSRKIARAINASNGRYPVILLANLSGFDGSPESLRRGQLEYGSEIAQAVQRFTCPIYLVILSRYHGGAYVVFSKRLNPRLEAVAISGSFASVIGGGPAASIIFQREVRERAAELGGGPEALRQANHEIANHFDQTHSISRAQAVSSIDEIIEVGELRFALSERLKKDYNENL